MVVFHSAAILARKPYIYLDPGINDSSIVDPAVG